MLEELNLLPCPALRCQGEAKFMAFPGEVAISVKCMSCGLGIGAVVCTDCDAPHRDMLMRAAAIWNALPRTPTWTTEPPKVAGHYWWVCDKYTATGPQVACIKVGTNHMASGLHMRFIDCGPTYHHCDKCRWAGPIPMPKEPTP